MEKNAIENFCTFTRKSVVVVHQKDPSIAAAFASVGYEEILDDDGSIKDGKAEGMILGLVLAHLAGKKYIGYVDADNYIPGAVFEYVRAYATGFTLSQSDYSMVRMLWHSKPKIVESNLYFAKYGRASVITNDFLNRLISYHTGFETEVIKTGNAGEHALTTSLALLLDYAPGYAIEPYHYVNLLERFGGVSHSLYPDVMRQGVDVYQIESRNPHLHASKGERHVQNMIYSSLQAIYHSTAVSETLRHEILVEMRRRRLIGKTDEPAPLTRYPALADVDFDKFARAIDGRPFATIVGNVA
jgi:mannosyl-3-phosphoglycerate synthase